MSDSQNPVWFITGCSTGFGRELVLRVLQRGWNVVVSARNAAQIADIVENQPNTLAVKLDVTDQGQIDAAVAAAVEKFGRIDVLVNNAGYGYQSSAEEGEEHEIRAMFDANVFGLFALTRAVLPVMRAQKRGHILNITSVAGLIGYPASAYYSASKHAVEGFSDSLRVETAALGIQVTCVEPGPFRTDWAGRSLKQTPNKIADYADTAGARLDATKARSGNQAGDPVRASDIMIELTQRAKAPRHIVLGAFGYDAVTKRLEERLAEISSQKEASYSADYPTG